MYQIYQVEPYDTLESISNKFNTTIEELKKINDIVNFTPIIGAPLIVPKYKNQNYNSYIVQKGDSLYSISSKFKTTPIVLARLNGLEVNDYIYPGQEMLIPNDIENIYIVEKGENINNILDKLNINIEELINMNDNLLLEEEQLIFYKRDKTR